MTFFFVFVCYLNLLSHTVWYYYICLVVIFWFLHAETAWIQSKNETKNAKDLVNQANLKAQERGDKLRQLGDKSDELADNARNFNDLAKQLAKKKWWMIIFAQIDNYIY